MIHTVNTKWTGNMCFDSEVEGHHVIIDAANEVGGENKGPSPKKLMLTALAGCTGMDVVSILKKMRVVFDSLNIRVDADCTEEHPKHYTKMHITYEFTGKDLDMEKLKKAADLSHERYCGVSAAYSKGMVVDFEIKVKSEK